MTPKTQTNYREATSEHRIGYSGLYLERSGVEADVLAEVLVAAPERPLSDEETAEARQFEAGLLVEPISSGVFLEDTLKTPMVEATVAPLFFAEGIMSGEVHIDGLELPTFDTSKDVYKWVAASGLDTSQLLALSKKSTEVYQQRVVAALAAGRPIDGQITEARSIVIEPEDFSKKMSDLGSAREILLELKKGVPRGTDIADAKVAYVEVFLAKINTLLAAGIPMVETLREQAIITGNHGLERQAEQLVSPRLLRALEVDESRKRLYRRLDFLRNGVGYTDSGVASSVAGEVATGTAEAPSGGLFSPEQMQRMKEIMLEPEEMVRIFRDIIAKAGMLSSEDASTWSPSRTHRAADGLFQVLINPAKTTFEVDSTSGAFKVASAPRSLYDVMIVGCFHELEHINQATADEAVGQTVKIAKIKGKRVSGLREAGANVRQRQAEQELFGYQKPYADTYASALRALEDGGSMGDAIQAFYDARLRALPDTNKPNAAKEAADRVLRLIRGGINSQPMVYAEESILMNQLQKASSEAQARALAVTGLDLADQVKLHAFGLLDVPVDTSINWSEHIMTVLKPYLEESRPWQEY